MKKILLFSLATAFALPAAHAQLRTWDGGATGNWNTTTNWTDDNVPDVVTESARIDANAGQNTTVTYNTSGITIGALTVDSGDVLTW